MRRAALALSLFLAAAAAAAQSPAADWRTVETAHFRIHYPAPFEAWAHRAAGSIEAIHARVAELVGYTPGRRIEVVVADPEASANGIAYPFLDRPVVVLWTSAPEAESSIGSYTDWMELLVAHEVAHIVHLTRPRNRAGLLARLSPLPFGPIALRSPRWLTEGYATLLEGELTGSGRPLSSFRSMVLRQLAIEGKLPSYGGLSGGGGWLGGATPYLVGSAFLEWLEAREGKDALPRLWKRMASRRGGSFGAAFRGVFGRSAPDLYDRFTAEATARAIEEEKRLEAEGLVAGERWQRLRGGTLAPQVSRDGSRILVRRDPERGESLLAVWEIGETEDERVARERRRRADEALVRDPNEVADRGETPRPRRPRWRLPRENGFAAANPRFLGSGERVLFARRAPDAEGALRWDLWRWELDSGRVERITRLADVSDADPSPDARWAVGVHGRYGRSSLVRVDLETGQTREISSGGESDPWRVWSHPRLSPDGSRIAALLHASRKWRLVTLPAGGGEPTEVPLPGSPVGPPAWSADGTRLLVATDASGIWNVAEVAADGSGFVERTRVTGGAFAPAPTPDGEAIFFLEMTARGLDLRRLDLHAAPPALAETRRDETPLRSAAPLELAAVAAPHPYDAWATQVIRPLSGFSLGPSGNSWQLGADGVDVVGRLSWLAAGSIGNAAGPRGGALAAAWRGWPVEVLGQVFSSLEKPGSQSLVPRPELDEERLGGYLGLAWGRPFSWGRVRLEAGGGATRVEALEQDTSFTRALGSAGARGVYRSTRGRSGFAVELDLQGALGATGGAAWRQLAVGGKLSGIASFATLSASAGRGDTGGSPSVFDLFRIGGAGSTILPPGLDRNRIGVPALPAAVQLGERFETYGAELSTAGLPLRLYAEWLRAWNGSDSRPDPVRVVGGELRLERLLPAELSEGLQLYVGVAGIWSDAPFIRATRGYAGLVYRP